MIGLNKKTYRKKNSFMNDFTKNMAQALFNQDEINDLLRKELQQTVNDLLEAELTAFLGYDPYARAGWNTGNSLNGAYGCKNNSFKNSTTLISMASL